MRKSDIKNILDLSNIRDRAFFCIMAQSGLRLDTLSNLKRKHVEPEFSKGIIPCKVDVPEDIAKGMFRSYFSFMAEEAVRYLKIYFIIRKSVDAEDYLFTLQGTNQQLNTKSMSGIFSRTIEKMKEKGLIDFEQPAYGKPRTLRLHSLNKFFRKYASHAGIEYVNFWIGYKTTDINKDVEFQRQLYATEVMPFLKF